MPVPHPSALTRRRLLAVLAAAAGTAATKARARAVLGSEPLAVTLYPALTETVVALGVRRFGAAGLSGFRSPIGLVAPSPEAFDVGTAQEPNLELLIQMRPSMFLHSPEWSPDPDVLRPIAPVVEIPIYEENGDAYANAVRALGWTGDLLEVPGAATAYRQRVARIMERARRQVRDWRSLRFLVVNSPDATEMGTEGPGGLFDGVLREIGLTNVVSQRGNYWGSTSISMKELMRLDDVYAVHVGPIPRKLEQNPFWQVLPFVRQGRIVVLPKIWLWGGLPSAAAFAISLGDAMGAAHDQRRS
ncbi:MAG: ABC transporter substrate-binding protein [Pseudomonadota bacterium]